MAQAKAVRTATKRKTVAELLISQQELSALLRLEREKAVIEMLITLLDVTSRSINLDQFRKHLTRTLKARSEAVCEEISAERTENETTSSPTTLLDEKPRWTGL